MACFLLLPVADKKCPNLSPLLRVNEISQQAMHARRVARLLAGSFIPQMGAHRGGGRGLWWPVFPRKGKAAERGASEASPEKWSALGSA